MLTPPQQKAITTTEGAVLLIAGPGTGKTFTIVKRIAHLVADMGVKLSEIMVVTFTEKAARELLTRISDEFAALGLDVNLNEMYIGTFHAVCLRLLKENTELCPDGIPGIVDAFESTYMVCRNIDLFRNFSGFARDFPASMGVWKQSEEICRYVSRLREELADIHAMENSPDDDIRLLAKLMKRYDELFKKRSVMDFSMIQTLTYNALKADSAVLERIQNRLRYIMVDEYQDTNCIQEKLMFLLAAKHGNICVVGDDDQGMYRFRGATIRNILEFPNRFPEGKCEKIYLDTNFRSQTDIIRFYGDFMENAPFEWNCFRFEKHLSAGRSDKRDCHAVFRSNSSSETISMLKRMKADGTITDYNQVAFLFRSVKSNEALELMSLLESEGIPVYSPRSELFFMRSEVKQIIGLLIMCFADYFADLRKNTFIHAIPENLRSYYKAGVGAASLLVKADKDLHDYISWESVQIKNSAERILLDVFYKIISFAPFRRLLSTSLDDIAVNVRASRNIAEISRIISRFGRLHDMHTITEALPEQFFNVYLNFLFIDGIGEYEDNAEYAPHGCVSFMTIHQSKGLEFPVVIAGSLGNTPKLQADPLMLSAELNCFGRGQFEPHDMIGRFDFWRLYYTAFSRAQDMLILCSHGDCPCFEKQLNAVPDVSGIPHDTAVSATKKAHYKRVYSFTSHISIYDSCPLQYKYYKELGMAQHKMLHTSIGSIVHETLESMNKYIISGGRNVTEDMLREWFSICCSGIEASTGYSLDGEQKNNALRHVLCYFRNRGDDILRVWKSEEEINLILSDFILQGIIDLIEYDPGTDTLEIIDYKTGAKPDVECYPDSIDHYRRQLEIYAFLAEKRLGKRVSGMKLYYTSVFEGDPWVIFEYNKNNIDAAISELSRTIRNIENRNFTDDFRNTYSCHYCNMKYFCRKQNLLEEIR